MDQGIDVMNVWDFLLDFFQKVYSMLTPVFEADFGGFTYWQYALFAFLFASFCRFVLPLVSGGSIGMGSFFNTKSDSVNSSPKGK